MTPTNYQDWNGPEGGNWAEKIPTSHLKTLETMPCRRCGGAGQLWISPGGYIPCVNEDETVTCQGTGLAFPGLTVVCPCGYDHHDRGYRGCGECTKLWLESKTTKQHADDCECCHGSGRFPIPAGEVVGVLIGLPNFRDLKRLPDGKYLAKFLGNTTKAAAVLSGQFYGVDTGDTPREALAAAALKAVEE